MENYYNGTFLNISGDGIDVWGFTKGLDYIPNNGQESRYDVLVSRRGLSLDVITRKLNISMKLGPEFFAVPDGTYDLHVPFPYPNNGWVWDITLQLMHSTSGGVAIGMVFKDIHGLLGPAAACQTFDLGTHTATLCKKR